MERFCKKGNKDKSTKFRNLSESDCEDAFEMLQEIVDSDVSLHIWFDRGLDFGMEVKSMHSLEICRVLLLYAG